MQGKSLLIITGSMGAGKSSVLCEASDILARQSIVHAALDLDAFGFAHLPSGASNDAIMYRNFQCVCKNYAALGVRRFLVARAIEDRAALQCCREVARVAKLNSILDGARLEDFSVNSDARSVTQIA